MSNKFLDYEGLQKYHCKLDENINGKNNIKGNNISKSFKVSSIDVPNNIIIIWDPLESNIINLQTLIDNTEKDIEASIRINGTRYEKCAKIISTEYTSPYAYFTVEFNENMPQEIISNSGSYGYLRIIGHPEIGDQDFEVECAVTSGKDNIASESFSDAGGRWCVADGKYSFTRGSTNFAGYCAAALGSGNTVLAQGGFSAGGNNTIEYPALNAATFGLRNWAEHPRTIICGLQTPTDISDQAVFGAISASVSNALLKVGNGKENGDGTFTRSNAFVVHADGNVAVQKEISASSISIAKGNITYDSRGYLTSRYSNLADKNALCRMEDLNRMSPMSYQGDPRYSLSNVDILNFIISSDCVTGISYIFANSNNGVTGLPSEGGTYRCLVTKSIDTLTHIEAWLYNGHKYINTYDPGSNPKWCGWQRIDNGLCVTRTDFQSTTLSIERDISNIEGRVESLENSHSFVTLQSSEYIDTGTAVCCVYSHNDIENPGIFFICRRNASFTVSHSYNGIEYINLSIEGQRIYNNGDYAVIIFIFK